MPASLFSLFHMSGSTQAAQAWDQAGRHGHLAGGREACRDHDALGKRPNLIGRFEQHCRAEREADVYFRQVYSGTTILR